MKKRHIFYALILFVGLYLIYSVGYNLGQNETTAKIVVPAISKPNEEKITADQLFRSTNNERQKAGLNLLDYSPYLEESATDKCADMIANNYWQHNTPSGKEPWAFMKKYNIQYINAGENLAYGFKNSSDVMTNWMNSPEHKENILDPKYTAVGFGICHSQNFMSKGPQFIVVQHFIAD